MSRGGTALQDELEPAGFVPVASKLYAPAPGLVSRRRLLERVGAARSDLVVVVAPAGYGKSTFLAELTADGDRPTAWLSLSASDDDPATLLAYVASALDDIEPVDPRYVSALWLRSPTIETPARQAFGAMLADRERPFTLVIDDLHLLRRRESFDTLAALVAEMPSGSRLALASRTAIELPLGRLRTRRRLVEIGPADLAFDELEVVALLEQLATVVDAADVTTLVERTEGWPVAVYLAALAHNTRTRSSSPPISEFGGDHRFLVDYLNEEMLTATDAEEASFLLEASCFERVTGALCDEVLERTGSAQLLEAARRRNLLVVPLDDRCEWYRFHHLMTEFLQTEMARRDPARKREIHRRASEWYHAVGDADGAISHAVRSGDLDHAGSLVMQWFGRFAVAGRNHTIDGWLALFTSAELDTHPDLMISAAHACFTDGDPGGATRWLTRASTALAVRHPPQAHGPEAAVMLAVSRAVIMPLSAREMAEEGRYAYERVGTGVGHPLSCLALGASAFLLGDEDGALRSFREGAATTLHRPIIEGTCLAHIAVIEVARGDWEQASVAARQARALIGDDPGPTSALVLAVSVLIETHAGRPEHAEADRMLCRQHLTALLGVAPWLNVQARIALGHAAALVGTPAEAAALTAEAEQLASEMTGAVLLHRQLAALRRTSPPGGRSRNFGPSSLTTAELRVLQFLPTHLSNAEIGDRLYVSRHTIKTQMISIYRKLGTHSRSGAVALATDAGLLEPHEPATQRWIDTQGPV